MTVKALAKKANVNNKTISYFINDNDNISIKNICKILNGLDINYEEVRKEIGTNLRKYRESKGLSMNQLATITGGSHTAMSRYESFDGNMTLDYMIDIAKGLGVSPYDLYSFSETDVSLFNVEEHNVSYDGPKLMNQV
ncbi:helix-turn-helix transcriptional regulator [Mycoplasmatota bacterium WC44]